ncbi:MAG: acyl-CoA dehydratase activase [Candidatus Aenigmatarchaeota archaeon]
MITAGIDIGSVTTKCVVLVNGAVKGMALEYTKADPAGAAKSSLKAALSKAGVSKTKLNLIATTGYGRRAVDFGDMVVTEISANAKGAKFIGCDFGQIRTIIDLGGQDSKVIVLDENGVISNFIMNDKCSAGTGRFLEVMAGILGTNIDRLGEISLKSKNPLKINSTCTVFAESEVVSLIARKKRKEDIIAGLHEAIAKKISIMGREVGIRDAVFFDGGGAKNKGLHAALEKQLGRKIYVPKEPQFVTATGAALYAAENK